MDLHRAQRELAASGYARRPYRHDATPETAEELQARLEEAGAALLGLWVKGTRPGGYRSGMPEVIHSAEEAYGWEELTEADLPPPSPNARGVSRMDEALGWVRLILLDPPPRGSGLLANPHGGAVRRRIVMARLMVNPRTGRHLFSWRRIAKMLGCSHQAAANWHAQALAEILRALHRPAGSRHNGGPALRD